MKVRITYPHVEKKKRQRAAVIAWARWPFILAAMVLAAVNLALGGPAWSLIGIWAIWVLWTFFISPTLVEYNRISLWIRFITDSCIMLLIIDGVYTSGWAFMVVPIVHFGGLFVSAVLFFTDVEQQKHNMMPILFLIVTGLISSVSGIAVFGVTWELLVMGSLPLALLIIFFVVLKFDFVRELKKRFHIR
jgi:hypothetical protein